MAEAYHRALMAFPDEDVVVGSRFVTAGALDAFKELDDVTPSPGSRAVGEERAWGRRLAKRFEVEGAVRREVVRRPQGRPGGLHRLRVGQAGGRRPGPPGAVRQRAGRQGRRAHRLRLDDGRGPRQARRAALAGAEAVPELADVVRSRRMTRAFDTRPVPRERARRDRRPRVAGARAPARRRAGTSSSWRAPRRRGSGTSRCRRCGAARSAGSACSTPRSSPSRSPTRGPTSSATPRPTSGRAASAPAPRRGRRRTGRSTRRCR